MTKNRQGNSFPAKTKQNKAINFDLFEAAFTNKQTNKHRKQTYKQTYK
jgi:hypothetical protein